MLTPHANLARLRSWISDIHLSLPYSYTKQPSQSSNPSSATKGKESMEDIKQILSFKVDKSQIKPGDHIYSWRKAWLYAHHAMSIKHHDMKLQQALHKSTRLMRFAIMAAKIGIYVGDEKVIHFTRGGGQEIGTGTVLDRILLSSSPSNSGDPCLKCGDQSNADGVIASCLDCFLSGGDLYLFRYSVSPIIFLAKARGGTCTLANCDPPEDVVHRAQFLLENGFGGYNIFKNNCEDFAIYCKTGILVFTTISVGRSGQAASFLAFTSAAFSSPLRYMTSSFPGLAVVGCGIYCISRYVADIGMRRDVTKISVEELVGSARLAEPLALIETDMVPHACVKELEALISKDSQVSVERLEVAEALVEEAKVAEAPVATAVGS
ncbi:LRAT-like domain-containing protein [Cynara cardunculus var. scolymus]|uniref:LRAT-like domain-containing protein n=1 Tax=Cynara cardunculus var. scolymus TaxID=59895 RepID=A0A103Y8Z6_CYNCS|nr:LRAT-like domain-containing protein [Cynara cardunculus var. scolymus]